jgi:hypothetical protein
MTHRVTRHPGAYGSTLYEARTDLHRIVISSPYRSAGDRQWCASVYLYGFAMSRGPEAYYGHAATPSAAASAVLGLLPPQHRDEIAPALQAILDTPALEPTK